MPACAPKSPHAQGLHIQVTPEVTLAVWWGWGSLLGANFGAEHIDGDGMG